MRKSAAYGASVLLFSYLVTGILYFSGALNQSTMFVFSMAYMLFPLLTALLLDLRIYKVNPVASWGLRFRFNRWLFSPLVIITAFVMITIIINLLFPGTRLEFDHIEIARSMMSPEQFESVRAPYEMIPSAVFYLMQLVSAVIAGYTINALFAFGEETGWRGHLLNTFEGRPFWQAWLFSGALWGIWHAPLVLMGHNYPEHPVIGVAMMTLWCILLTPVFIYVRVKSRSVYGASFLHGFLNALAGFPLIVIIGGNDLTKGVTGVPGMITLLLMNAALFGYDKYISRDMIMTSDICLQDKIIDSIAPSEKE